MIGKWALGTHGSSGAPQNKGFDQFAGFLTGDEAENDYSDYIWRYDPNPVSGTFDNKMQLSQNDDGKQGTTMEDLFTTVAMNFVHINKPQKYLHWRAFFLWLAYPVPHAADADRRTACRKSRRKHRQVDGPTHRTTRREKHRGHLYQRRQPPP